MLILLVRLIINLIYDIAVSASI